MKRTVNKDGVSDREYYAVVFLAGCALGALVVLLFNSATC